jgi:hypothetical protein
LELVVKFRPGRIDFPTQAVIEGKVGARPPTVLDIEARVVVAPVVRKALSLLEPDRSANQVVGEIDAGLRPLNV